VFYLLFSHYHVSDATKVSFKVMFLLKEQTGTNVISWVAVVPLKLKIIFISVKII